MGCTYTVILLLWKNNNPLGWHHVQDAAVVPLQNMSEGKFHCMIQVQLSIFSVLVAARQFLLFDYLKGILKTGKGSRQNGRRECWLENGSQWQVYTHSPHLTVRPPYYSLHSLIIRLKMLFLFIQPDIEFLSAIFVWTAGGIQLNYFRFIHLM